MVASGGTVPPKFPRTAVPSAARDDSDGARGTRSVDPGRAAGGWPVREVKGPGPGTPGAGSDPIP